MRLLVTRPMLDALPLAEQLAARGHDVVISPLIHIEPVEADLPDAAGFQALAFTSANGVRALAAKCKDAAELAAWQSIKAYAVGPQTAATLSAHGWANPHIAGGDVVALAAALAAHIKTDNKDSDKNSDEDSDTVLHIAGRDRAGDLAAALDAAQIKNQRTVLYRAAAADEFTAAAQAALCDKEEPLDGVLIYSARTAKIFRALFARLDNAAKPTIYCLSKAVADELEADGFITHIAETPTETATEAAMLAAF